MPLNLERLRRSNNARLRQYERFGIRVFTEALKLQAVPNLSAMPMQDAYIRFYQEVFVDSAKREYNRIRMQEKAFVPSDFFLNTWREWIKSWVIENLGFLITEVTETTRKRVQAILGEAIEQGLNPTQTQDLLLQEIPDIKRARAIARTESTRANNMGKKRSATEYANQSGDVLYKVWIWGGSREPRLEHVQLQNKPIRADQNFIGINGKPMDVPGDRQGGPENTINCSCSVVYISERLARRRYPDAFSNRQQNDEDQSFRTNETQVDEDLFYSMFDSETNRKINKILQGSDGLNDIINRKKSFVSIQPDKYAEDSAEFYRDLLGKEKFDRLSKGPDSYKLFANIGEKSNGIASLDGDFMSIKMSKNDQIKFESKNLTMGKQDYDDLISKGYVEVYNDSYGKKFLVPTNESQGKKYFLNDKGIPVPASFSNRYQELNNGIKNKATTIIHEGGHIIQAGKDQGLEVWNRLMSENNIDLINDAPSFYGSTNEYEFFAESFTAFVFDNKGLKKNNPKVFGLLDKYFKALGIDKSTIRLAK